MPRVGGLPGVLLSAGLTFVAASVACADVVLVREGQPAAVIVTATDAPPSVAYAAQELVHHVEQATGVRLPVMTEAAAAARTPTGPRIYLGATAAARAQGLEAAALAMETFALRCTTDALFIAGRDTNGDPLDRDTSAGTLFGVYEWLERDLGVRWLWPGELGTFVPATRTVVARTNDLTLTPPLVQRQVRNGATLVSGQHPALGFTPAAAAEYARVQAIFLRRHRMGRGGRMNYGHAFTNWWARFGAQHPEWFQLVNGKRGPAKPSARYAMCVSNPELHREIVAQWRARGGADPARRPSFINVVENDILGQCECASCRAWDGPTPPDVNRFYSPNFRVHGAPFVSDRYARFAQAVQALAARENPHAVAIGYAYFNYFQAPTSGVQLNENVLIGYCPSAGWYPRFDDEHEWYQRQWTGWRETGARLFSRTNYFLDGYVMPFIFARQFADDFQHQATAGMVGTDFDSLTGHWATQGPNLYLLMRLPTRPTASIDRLLAEYYSGFGPAAAEVKAYFDYWERYAMDNRPLIRDVFEDRVAVRWRTWAKAAHRVFPPGSFAPAEALLARAARAAGGNDEATARVDFLQRGLTHARLAAKVSSLLTLADATATPERGAEELKELLRFRRANERWWISNFNHAAWVEELSWKLSAETRQEPELFP